MTAEADGFSDAQALDRASRPRAQSATYLDKASGLTKTDAATTYAAHRDLASLKPLHVGDTNGIQAYSTVSDGVALDMNAELRHNLAAGEDISEIQYVYENANLNGDGPNDITVRAGMYLNGAWLPLYFGGKRDVVIPPGGRAITDPLPVSTTGFAFFESRTKVSVTTAGQKWPITYACSATRSEWAVTGAAGDDFTTSGNQTSNSNNTFGPVAIMAKTTRTDRDVVALIGDSITAGTGAASPLWFNSFSRLAATAKGKTSVNVGYAGSSSGVGYGFAFVRRAIPIIGATHSMEMYGTNDIGALTIATLQSRLLSSWRDRKARSMRVYACTIIPKPRQLTRGRPPPTRRTKPATSPSACP